VIRLTGVIEAEHQAPRALLYESSATTIILGRDPGVDFPIPMPTVSRRHARILEVDGIYTIEDLNSTHGTIVNGKRLEDKQRRVLRNGDVIEFFQVKISVMLETSDTQKEQSEQQSIDLAHHAVRGILGHLGESDAQSGPYLRVISAELENETFYLRPPLQEWIIGRSKDCEWQLNDPNVSRRHIRVRKSWSGYHISDMGSKNGVMINDRLIQHEITLKNRDQINIGPLQLVFVDPDGHLLDALREVPGFGADRPEENNDGQSEEKADANSPTEAKNPEDLFVLPPNSGEASPAEEQQAIDTKTPEEDIYADIDPKLLDMKLLEQNQSKWQKWREPLIIGGITLLVLIGTAFVFFLF
jgi:pSer/pThr/pTyr-binding forkhead associated (FHA) protein